MNGIDGLIVINGINHFPISWLHSKGFCEYQLYLEKIKKIKVEKTTEMIIGKQIHAELEKEFLEQAEEEMTIEEALSRSKETGESFLIRELETISRKYGIYGKIDEVQILPESVVIIDDKPGNVAYQGLIKQVSAYSLSFLEEFKPDREIFSALRNRDNKEVFWNQKFDKNLLEMVVKDILEIHDLIRDVRFPESSTNPQKCLKCRFRKVCDRSLA
ncbi:MAG: Dna2/Cas4 domain-containing protein [Candidatus Aenigmatarchaeota archaeon]